uniref:Uncharacterized protein n=1 Tax=viral metagenome TaxID=1070528 RepID=A0A6M3X8N9_9ZZZZ
MKKVSLDIPVWLAYLAMGTSGFFGFGSFVSGITANIIYGYVAGCFGFVIMIILFKDLRKRLEFKIKQQK